MKLSRNFLMISLLAAVLVLPGCGKKAEETAALNQEDLEMLANLADGTGSAQTAVEIIPVPPAPIQQIGDTSVEMPARLIQSNAAVTPAVPHEATVETTRVLPTYKNDANRSFDAKIQIALERAGYYKGKVDGKVGPMTRKAIEAFQRDNKLKADGIAGANTWVLLKDYYYEALEPSSTSSASSSSSTSSN